jgi:hypothetical protein
VQEVDNYEYACYFLLGVVVTRRDWGIRVAFNVAIRTASKPTGDIDFVHHHRSENSETELVKNGNNLNHPPDPAVDWRIPALGL